jgi:hypothetical protein
LKSAKCRFDSDWGTDYYQYADLVRMSALDEAVLQPIASTAG